MANQTHYTKPALREELKEKIRASSKAGEPGQWSARKARLLALEYKKKGGGYLGGHNRRQERLNSWGARHSSHGRGH
jgi:hypothetical protein